MIGSALNLVTLKADLYCNQNLHTQKWMHAWVISFPISSTAFHACSVSMLMPIKKWKKMQISIYFSDLFPFKSISKQATTLPPIPNRCIVFHQYSPDKIHSAMYASYLIWGPGELAPCCDLKPGSCGSVLASLTFCGAFTSHSAHTFAFWTESTWSMNLGVKCTARFLVSFNFIWTLWASLGVIAGGKSNGGVWQSAGN